MSAAAIIAEMQVLPSIDPEFEISRQNLGRNTGYPKEALRACN